MRRIVLFIFIDVF